ncbi:bifunctional pyr operon transcriptional regulator/uracil phosphoribosyltransferase PyrR [Desulfovibrio litoralis]|uniref:Bifunctional protein PyrR n=1 Tax=Desulfovibrio litoralis DSM 11393 TaxID=1121455 RepID=A0A1M7TRL3_9BACT|nr:bifunctional pyr operon transcriptional regulator/uracil phosphoribosyltransferase PyrR [Desulfovibrio litoralis]SHN73355.1 pyrimidine operon attenuation protein / uracil phosphoribosyltransferase [Desulfovibrio litoralis DSM 11393]
MSKTTELMNATEISRSIERLTYQIIENHGKCTDLALVGIQRRGVCLAKRLKEMLDTKLKNNLNPIPLGILDINLYRDDWTTLTHRPAINSSNINFNVEEKHIILVDDVLYSGRTIRAALEAILDYGRPKKVELLVLVDRGRRELPIQADYIGKALNTSKDERVDVAFLEQDGKDEVLLKS